VSVVFEPHRLPGATARQVAVAGVRFALQRGGSGTGTPVVLLHGVPQTAVMWREVFPELSRDRVVLAPDLKGLGGSEAKAPYDVATLVAELAALVLHEVEGPVDVVGHDWGGSLAIALAATRPELVRRLVVLNAPFRRVDYLRAWHIPLFAVPLLPEAVFTLGGRRVVGHMLRYGWRATRPLDPAVRGHYEQAYADPMRVAAMLSYYRGALRRRVRQRVVRRLRGWRAGWAGGPPARVPRPERALVVWGARDPVLPLSVGDSVVRDLGPRTAMVTVPEAGHFVVEEAPQVVVPAVAAFLRAE
jgi:haloacetate dehalogenase